MSTEKELIKDAGFDTSANRLRNGEAYMICNECGSRLYSFYGDKDASIPCPKKRNGECAV